MSSIYTMNTLSKKTVPVPVQMMSDVITLIRTVKCKLGNLATKAIRKKVIVIVWGILELNK